jgi:hypothetical protein
MPQIDISSFFSIFETLVISFLVGYSFLSLHFLLPFVNILKIRYEFKIRLFFVYHLIIRQLVVLNSFYSLRNLKINFNRFIKS